VEIDDGLSLDEHIGAEEIVPRAQLLEVHVDSKGLENIRHAAPALLEIDDDPADWGRGHFPQPYGRINEDGRRGALC
jgi:hypothetical protein